MPISREVSPTAPRYRLEPAPPWVEVPEGVRLIRIIDAAFATLAALILLASWALLAPWP